VAVELIGAIGGITQGVARLLGLSKTARLRRAINDHIKLYASLENRDELKQAATQVAGLIELQTSQLVRREEEAARREYEWSNLVIGIVVGAILAAPLWWLLPAQSLWQGALAILLAILAALFVIVGASMVRKQPKAEKTSEG
jgi:uncharacterized membrane protein YoaK (UPF0700 family)